MRKLSMILASVGLVGVAHAAPEAAAPAVNVGCALYGECDSGETAAPVEEETPAPATTSAGRPRLSATRGFSMMGATATPTAKPAARPVAPPVAAKGGGSRPAAKVAVTRPKSPTAVKAMQAAEAIRTAQLITFRSGSADLTPQGMSLARQIATAMQRPDKQLLRFSLEGHTDAVGTKALNVDLSQRRASALASYLVSQGVAPSRLDTVGYGFDRPIEGLPGTSPANRRVEVRAIK